MTQQRSEVFSYRGRCVEFSYHASYLINYSLVYCKLQTYHNHKTGILIVIIITICIIIIIILVQYLLTATLLYASYTMQQYLFSYFDALICLLFGTAYVIICIIYIISPIISSLSAKPYVKFFSNIDSALAASSFQKVKKYFFTVAITKRVYVIPICKVVQNYRYCARYYIVTTTQFRWSGFGHQSGICCSCRGADITLPHRPINPRVKL